MNIDTPLSMPAAFISSDAYFAFSLMFHAATPRYDYRFLFPPLSAFVASCCCFFALMAVRSSACNIERYARCCVSRRATMLRGVTPCVVRVALPPHDGCYAAPPPRC